MTLNQGCLFALTTLLALAANACSASTARLARLGEAPVQCAGGVIQTADAAARLAGCTSIDGDLEIANSELTELSSLESLRSVSGALTIANNPKLISLHALNGLQRAGSVRIRNNRLLCAQLGFLPELGEVSEALVLSSNASVSKREIDNLRQHVKTTFDASPFAGEHVALH